MAADIDVNALIAELSGWEIARYVSIAAVAIGVIGESIHEFTGWWKRFDMVGTKGGKASAFLLIAALAAELVIAVKTNSISGQIIGFLSKEAAEARERTAKIEEAQNGVKSRRSRSPD